MSFNLANKPLAERAALEDEKSRLYDLWQSNLGKAKGDADRKSTRLNSSHNSPSRMPSSA